MPIQVTVTDSLIHGRDAHALQQAVAEGLIIRDYVNGEISIGEVKELLGLQYMDDAMDWLHQRGIATMRKFKDADLDAAQRKGFESLKNDLRS